MGPLLPNVKARQRHEKQKKTMQQYHLQVYVQVYSQITSKLNPAVY